MLIDNTDSWNEWRESNPSVDIDLSNADLRGCKLGGLNLSVVNLTGANLSRTNLSHAHLNGSNLSGADIRFAKLNMTYMRDANLNNAQLHGADLTEIRCQGSDFSSTNLIGVDLSEGLCQRANFSRADLSRADLSSAVMSECIFQESGLQSSLFINTNLINADFTGAHFGFTTFSGIDLSETQGLESTHHWSGSDISTNTLRFSKGKIPEVFLRGCGLSDWEIVSATLFSPDINNEDINNAVYEMFNKRAMQSIQISPLFISYSHADTPFVVRLEKQLTSIGVRYWRDVHNATSGRLEKQIDRAMRKNPTVLLVLSKSSIESDWVEHEARLAREIEKEIGRDVLCPIALDNSWKTAKWPARLMEQIKEYNILDYSKWADESVFEDKFNKMISGLDMFYK